LTWIRVPGQTESVSDDNVYFYAHDDVIGSGASGTVYAACLFGNLEARAREGIKDGSTFRSSGCESPLVVKAAGSREMLKVK